VLGADAVGMSTVPEVIVARHMNLPVFAVSVISDLGVKGKIIEISHEEVIAAVKQVTPKLVQIIKDLVKEL
jgi:purine-nucleoside phosphorylase